MSNPSLQISSTRQHTCRLPAWIILANAALLAAVWLANHWWPPRPALLVLGVVSAQVSLLSIWATWSTIPWFVRLPTTFLVAAMLSLVIYSTDPSGLLGWNPFSNPLAPPVLQTLTVLACLSVFRLSGTRLEVQAPAAAPAPRRRLQFSVSYLLLTVTVAALVLAAGRGLQHVKEQLDSYDRPFAILAPQGIWAFSSALVGLAAFWAAFPAGRLWLSLPTFCVLAPAMGLIYPWLREEYEPFIQIYRPSSFWWCTAATAFQAGLVAALLLTFRCAGYRIRRTQNGSLSSASPWLAVALLSTIVGGWWLVARSWTWGERLRIKAGGAIWSLGFSPDNVTLATGSRLGQPVVVVVTREEWKALMELWDTETGARRAILSEGGLPVAFSPNGETLAAFGDGIELWDMATGQLETSVAYDDLGAIVSAKRQVGQESGRCSPLSIGYGADKVLVAAWAWKWKQVAVLDISAREQRAVLAVGWPDYITSALFSPKADTVALFCDTPAVLTKFPQADVIRLFDLGTEREQAALKAEDDWFYGGAFSPDGRTFAATDRPNYVSRIRLWDVATGRQLAVLEEPDLSFALLTFAADHFHHVAFAPDGKTLAVGGAEYFTSSLADLDLFSVAGVGKVVLYDLATLQARAVLRGHRPVDHVAFSPDGKTLATASYQDNTVVLWDVRK